MIWHVDRPETHELAREIRKVVGEFGDDKVLLAEIVLPVDQTVAYYGTDGDGIQVPFNFELLTADWDARGLATFVDDYLAAIPPGGWPNWVLGNHDVPRVASRIGVAQARNAAVLLLTLPGTPTLYYGDELGVRDAVVAPEQVRDPIAELIPGRGRDPERAPMPWDASPGAGFTTGEPWLPFPPDVPTVNVAAQEDDPDSMLTLHRRLLALRRRTTALTGAGYRAVAATGDVLAYERADEDSRWLVALNLGDRPAAVDLPAPGRVELSTLPGRDGDRVAGTTGLRPDEGLVVQLEG